MVESGEDHAQHEGRPAIVYRRDDGEAYALGFREDVNLWKGRGYRPMGTVAFIRDRMAAAEEEGVQEESVTWFLLKDVEREQESR
jgi:hypothetical protein